MTHVAPPRPIEPRPNSVMFRTCTRCGDTKRTRTDFRWMETKEAFHPWCTSCESEAGKERRQKKLKAQEAVDQS